MLLASFETLAKKHVRAAFEDVVEYSGYIASSSKANNDNNNEGEGGAASSAPASFSTIPGSSVIKGQ